MDWSEKNSCIKCDEGGNVLVCSEKGCPLAVHEGCMGCPARFDDAGKFYCPYCLYKQAVAESRQAREYALARKKALLAFMDEDMLGREKRSEVKERAEASEHNQSKSGEAVNITRCSDDRSRRNSDSVLDQSIRLDEEHNIIDAQEEKIQGEGIEASTGSKCRDPSLQMPEEQKISNEEETKIHDEEHEASATSSSQGPSFKMREQGLSNADEERITEEERETSSGEDSLPLGERAYKRRRSMRVNSETVSMRNKQSDKNKQTSPSVNSPRRSSRRSSSALRTEQVLKEKVEVSKRLKQPEMLSFKLANDTFSSGKRKRLLWREEEEEMLKVGVQKYSDEPSKKLPWRKILDMGRHVFDGTRTPGDLKDKWRNMSAK
ncbi:hypothetical protein OROHE_012852 [Orobanche hederae]